MKLYYSAGSCSMSCHIALEESGLPYDAIEIDWDKTSDPNLALVSKLNPLGTLPILITQEGKQLDQNLAIHSYIADRAPDRKLLPSGTFERAKALNWLSFVASDLHKGLGGLFSVGSISPDQEVRHAVRKYMVERAQEYINYVDRNLSGQDYFLGREFCLADGYAFVVLRWTKWLDVSLEPYKNVQAYMHRVASRPAVQRVLKAEGEDE